GLDICRECWSGRFPSLHHPKEGWLRHQENFAKPPKPTQPGWSSFCSRSENHPVCAIRGCFAIFLLAQTPLLAVTQGGESAFPVTILTLNDSARASRQPLTFDSAEPILNPALGRCIRHAAG